jgi:ABC-2 type transport system ATP-binding protein
LFGEDPQSIDARRRIGVMMQEINLSPVMKPREFIAQTASYYPSPYETAAVVKRLGIEKIADRAYGKLSGGQKRQVQFALALVGRPELIFLDEPTVGLDVQAREALWKVVRDLKHEGCSIVLTTHYLEEAEALADRVAVMARGRLIANGSVEEIRAHVTRKEISCLSNLSLDTLRAWPEVMQAERERDRLRISTRSAEVVLTRLFGADPALQDIEVRRAGLAEAFTELTTETKQEKLS